MVNSGEKDAPIFPIEANDTVLKNNDIPTWGDEPNEAHLKGGNWYLLSSENATDSYENRNYTLLGPGGGMSEDELKQAIDDAIHNVQGDQTVNGSQDITGDQTVEGEQTVKSVA